MNGDPSHPEQTSLPPHLSPDGRHTWTGSSWVPTPGMDRKRSWYQHPVFVVTASVATVIAIGLTISGVALALDEDGDRRGFESFHDDSTFADSTPEVSSPLDRLDCDRLGKQAVRISEQQEAWPRLIDVRAAELVSDDRDDFDLPHGAKEVKVLVCEGVGIWGSGGRSPLRVSASVDADGDVWIRYNSFRR